MTVALDASYSLGPALSGIGVYCARLIAALTTAAPGDRFLLCYRANRFFRAFFGPAPPDNASRRLLEEPWNLLLPRRARLFHGLNQRLPSYRFPRAVTTFHDLFVMTGEFSTPEFRRRFTALARDAAVRSDHIVAVSAYTARLVQSLLAVESGRISVVHHGVDSVPAFDPVDLAAFRRRLRLERPFLLNVGAIQERKNLRRLVQAFEPLAGELDLVLAGSEGYSAAEIREAIAASAAGTRIRMLGYVDRATLNRLYRSAAALAFPSLDEGFGIPVLEAMSAGLPVVTSNRAAMVEVAGDAALLVDPTDVAALAAALRRVVEDTALRRELIRKGCSRAAGFTWERAAAGTLAVYHRLA